MFNILKNNKVPNPVIPTHNMNDGASVISVQNSDQLVKKGGLSAAKKTAIGVGIPLIGGLIAAATFGIIKFVPIAQAASGTLMSNPHLIPALIGVAAGVGACLLVAALVAAVRASKAKKPVMPELKPQTERDSIEFNNEFSSINESRMSVDEIDDAVVV